MGEVRTEPVRATRFDDIDSVRDTPGAFEFFEAKGRYPAGIIYSCPCGCKATGVLHFRPADEGEASWEWDGNEDAPTLSPSVHHVGHWHGWLQNGVWTSC